MDAPSRIRRLIRSAGAGLAATGLLALAPGVAGAATPVVGSGSGLTVPSGIATTPDGATWVSDDIHGVCKVSAGSSPALALDAWCGQAHAGPVAPAGLAFDPASNSLYVGDGAAQGGAVWRLRWDPVSGTLAGGSPLVRLGRDRVTAVALLPVSPGAPADVLFTTKESTAVKRIASPASAGTTPAPVAIAHASEPGAHGVVHLDGRLYIAEETDVTRVDLATGGPAERVPGLAGGVPQAIAADPARGRLYVGTANGLDDAVNVLETATGAIVPYARGFAGVTAVAVEPGGDLLVADDPGEAAGVMDAEGHGRLWRVTLRSIHRPSVNVDAAPPGVTGSPDARFAYSSAADATFECRLDGAAWAACPGAGSGETSYAGLADGVHAFEIRAVSADPAVGAGAEARRVFVVDTRAPRVWIHNSDRAEVFEGASIAVDLVADEFGVDFTCSLDGGPFEPCDSTLVLEPLALGAHDLRIRGVDRAGNGSDPEAPSAKWSWTVVPRPAPAVPAGPATPAAPVAAPQPPASTPVAALPRPARLKLVTARLARTARWSRGRQIAIRFDAPAGARAARVTLPVVGGRIATRIFRVRPGANRVVVRLSAREARRLRRGHQLVVVTLADADGRRGPSSARRLRVV